LLKLSIYRLRYHYQIAKQYDHGAHFVAEELYGDPVRKYVIGPWASDWLVPINLGAWALFICTLAYDKRPGGTDNCDYSFIRKTIDVVEQLVTDVDMEQRTADITKPEQT
jgi:hypothetical protein